MLVLQSMARVAATASATRASRRAHRQLGWSLGEARHFLLKVKRIQGQQVVVVALGWQLGNQGRRRSHVGSPVQHKAGDGCGIFRQTLKLSKGGRWGFGVGALGVVVGAGHRSQARTTTGAGVNPQLHHRNNVVFVLRRGMLGCGNAIRVGSGDPRWWWSLRCRALERGGGAGRGPHVLFEEAPDGNRWMCSGNPRILALGPTTSSSRGGGGWIVEACRVVRSHG